MMLVESVLQWPCLSSSVWKCVVELPHILIHGSGIRLSQDQRKAGSVNKDKSPLFQVHMYFKILIRLTSGKCRFRSL